MNGIETEAILFSLQPRRNCTDNGLRLVSPAAMNFPHAKVRSTVQKGAAHKSVSRSLLTKRKITGPRVQPPCFRTVRPQESVLRQKKITYGRPSL